ncbi:polysaccharide deacetylase family protein [Desulfovibrio inopinatus]|uniref:polysaccharide deacetylase family protein n=1 Tax=Desulfovibrio inopinatus TaxID=102109 RepID=UPI00041867A9|nr:polysaccharide deacetylase family protein [Desulfovibrio inopinatus]
MLTLTFDDGLKSVIQHGFPLLQKHHVPAVVGVISRRVESGDPDFLNIDDLKVLAQAGFEIASHGTNHIRPIEAPLTYTAEPLNAVRDSQNTMLWRASYFYPILTDIVQDNHVLSRVQAFSNLKAQAGSYFFDVSIGRIVIHPYPGERKFRAMSYEREMAQSKMHLEKYGFHISSYIVPYNYWTRKTRDLSLSMYSNVAVGGNRANYKHDADRHALKRFVVHSDHSLQKLSGIIEKDAIQNDGWVIFCLHGVGDSVGWEPISSQTLDALLTWVHQHQVDVVTLQEGSERLFGKHLNVVAIQHESES